MIAKQPSPSPVTVLPATTEHWADIEDLFTQTPCWCQSWRVPASEYGRPSKDELGKLLEKRRDALQAQLEHTPPPGVIAFMDETIVGWCGFWPRQKLQRLVHSRTIPAADDRPVWAIVCFLVRTGYRRRGVAQALLRGAIQCARAHGAPALEAYPVDPGDRRIDTAFAYVGTTAMFEREGFSRIIETSAHSAGLTRWLMRLELAS